jgi:hypothetical protein
MDLNDRIPAARKEGVDFAADGAGGILLGQEDRGREKESEKNCETSGASVPD